GSASRGLTLGQGCSAVSLLVGVPDGGDDASGHVDDLASADFSGSDFAGADFARSGPPDLSMNCADPSDPCQYPSAPLTDFDVAGDANVFGVYSADGRSITGTCFAP